MAFRFMEDFVRKKEKHKIDAKVTWKYLLFRHNDSDQELVDTQKKALDLRVDVLAFHTTPWVGYCKHSRFYRNKNTDFPRINIDTSSLKVISPNESNRNDSCDTDYEALGNKAYKWWQRR